MTVDSVSGFLESTAECYFYSKYGPTICPTQSVVPIGTDQWNCIADPSLNHGECAKSPTELQFTVWENEASAGLTLANLNPGTSYQLQFTVALSYLPADTSRPVQLVE